MAKRLEPTIPEMQVDFLLCYDVVRSRRGLTESVLSKRRCRNHGRCARIMYWYYAQF